MLNVRLFHVEHDLEEVNGWWKHYGWETLPPTWMPKISAIVSSEKEKLAVGWLYMTDSPIAILEWLVANPAGDPELRSQAVDRVIAHLSSQAKEAGAKAVMSFTKNASLLERYRKHDFVVTDNKMTHVMRSV